MAQGADFASRDGDFTHVEELDVRYWSAVQLVQNLISIGALDLIPVEPANNRHVSGDGPLVSGQGNLISILLGVVLNPVVHGGPADEKQFIRVEVKENPVADHESLVTGRNKLLGFIDGKILNAIDTRCGEQFERVRSLYPHIGHMVGLVEKNAGFLPGT